MGTFSKSLASLGGFIAGDNETINYNKHNARSIIFSAGIPSAAAASVLKALDIIKAEPQRIEQLWQNTHYAHQSLLNAGFDIGHSTTPILPILIGDEYKTYKLSSLLLKNGVYVNPVSHPAVEKGKALLRLSLMATHTKTQIDRAVEQIYSCNIQIDKEL